MDPLAIVEDFDLLEECGSCLLPIRVAVPPQQLVLQRAEEDADAAGQRGHAHTRCHASSGNNRGHGNNRGNNRGQTLRIPHIFPCLIKGLVCSLR